MLKNPIDWRSRTLVRETDETGCHMAFNLIDHSFKLLSIGINKGKAHVERLSCYTLETFHTKCPFYWADKTKRLHSVREIERGICANSLERAACMSPAEQDNASASHAVLLLLFHAPHCPHHAHALDPSILLIKHTTVTSVSPPCRPGS